MTTLQAAPAITPSRQRVLDALTHKEPDQLPVDFGSTSVTGIHVSGAVFLCGTYFGTQTSAFCSVPTFRELWLPYYKRIGDWIHAQTTRKCFKHSCGSVERFDESFLEVDLGHHGAGDGRGGAAV